MSTFLLFGLGPSSTAGGFLLIGIGVPSGPTPPPPGVADVTFRGDDPGRTILGSGLMISVPVVQKRVAYARSYGFDFGGFAEVRQDGLPIVGAGVTVTGVSDGMLTVGSPSISGSLIVAFISGGTPQRSYQLTCTATFSGSPAPVIDQDCIIDVVP